MKTTIKCFILFGLLLLSITVSSQSALTIKQYTLDNGFTVILNEDHSQPAVFGIVVVKAGSKNDPIGATGMAHYQEHMLFKGTEELGTINWEKEKPHINRIFELYDSLGATKDEIARKAIQEKINEESLKANEYAIPNELSNIIKGIGGTRLNANTGADRTVFFNEFPANQIEKWLEIYSHRFMNPVFRGFQSELEVVYEEKNLYSDKFQFSLIEEFNKQLFKKHPYGQQTAIGTIEDLKNPSLTKMYDFFKTYYVSNNMALILSGDFNPEDIMPIIKAKFGQLKPGVIPTMKDYKEDPFNGREKVVKRLSPIKIGMLGFRTVPNGHPDETALEVCNSILTNKNETGLLDKLTIENKLMAAMVLPMNFNEYGTTIYFIVPKIVGQKLEAAEKLVLGEIEKIGKGDFDDAMIEAVKNQLYVEFQTNIESLQQRAVMMAELYGQNQKMEELQAYPSKIKKVTREDVIRVAKTYYGNNYLAFFSKMGFPKKAKIDKPGYKPVLSNTDAKSAFVQRFDRIEVKDPSIKYIDFNTDIYSSKIQKGVDFYYVHNPMNDVFSLQLKFGIGDQKMPNLKYSSMIMGYAGVKDMAVSDFKKSFAKIGCSYSISSDDSYLMVSLEGIEANLESAVLLINKLFTTPILEKDKIDNIVQAEKTGRKMERSEPDNVSEALFQYVRYGNLSSSLNRLSMKEITNLTADTLVGMFKTALGYECQIHYVGQVDAEKVKNIIANSITFKTDPVRTYSPVVLDCAKYNENTVFFVDKKKAIQSKIYLLSNGPEFTIDRQPYIEAFNLYFGGDFSGLVLQEIREYRSLAYTAGATFKIPDISGKPVDFYGYVGTQADKTIEALSVFEGLIHSMPEKKERLDMVKQYLSLSAMTNRPDFRNLSQVVLKWKQQGYKDDPMKFKMNIYKNLTFDQITGFYHENLAAKPIVYSIVGNPSKIDMKGIEKFGKIIMVKEESLFK